MGRRALVAAGLIAGLAATHPARADAASARFALDPLGEASSSGYFQYHAAAGTTISGRVRVANLGRASGVVRLYAVDATTGQTTGAVYRDVGAPRRGVGAWTRLARHTIRLAPGASAIVGFTTRVPEGLRSGDHLGGIVIEDASVRTAARARRGKGKFSIRIRKLTIIALQLRVPGARVPRLALTSLRAGGATGRQALLLGIRNEGNVLVKGRGHLVVTGSGGATLQDRRFPIDTFVPRTAVELPVPVRGRRALGDGDYHGIAVLRYRGQIVRRAFDFSISKKAVRQVFGGQPGLMAPVTDSPLVMMLTGAGIAAAGFALAALLVGRRRRRRRAPVAPRPQPPHPPLPRAQSRTRGPRPRPGSGSRTRTRTPEEREHARRERQAQREQKSRA